MMNLGLRVICFAPFRKATLNSYLLLVLFELTVASVVFNDFAPHIYIYPGKIPQTSPNPHKFKEIPSLNCL